MVETFYHIFSNGIRLIHRPTASDVAYVGVMVGAGTRNELANESGMAHYIEHTLFKGTTHRTARQIINHIEDIGGDINAYTTKEETTFYAAVRTPYISRALSTIADMLFCPSFPKKETDKELQVILDEIESYNDSPSELIYDDFENLIFEGHSLQNPILGTPRSLKHFTKEKALAFLRANYSPARMVVFSTANLPMQRVVRLVEKYFGECPYSCSSATVIKVPEQQPQVRQFKRHTHQMHAMIGSRAYHIGHPHHLAFYMLNNILGGGQMSSLLNLSLREQKGLVYTVESTYTPLSDTGYWCIYFASDPEDAEQCIGLIEKQLKHLRETPLSTAAFSRALKQLEGQMAIAAENQENNALGMAKQVLYLGKAPIWQESFERIQHLTPKDLLIVANEMYDKSNLSKLFYI